MYKLCDVTGLGDAKVLNLKMGTCTAKITLSGGRHIIGIFHQYAIYGHGKSLHAPNQHRAFGHKVDDISKLLGGTQQATLSDGTIIPFCVHGGNTYMKTDYPSDEDMATYPHVIITSDEP